MGGRFRMFFFGIQCTFACHIILLQLSVCMHMRMAGAWHVCILAVYRRVEVGSLAWSTLAAAPVHAPPVRLLSHGGMARASRVHGRV